MKNRILSLFFFLAGLALGPDTSKDKLQTECGAPSHAVAPLPEAPLEVKIIKIGGDSMKVVLDQGCIGSVSKLYCALKDAVVDQNFFTEETDHALCFMVGDPGNAFLIGSDEQVSFKTVWDMMRIYGKLQIVKSHQAQPQHKPAFGPENVHDIHMREDVWLFNKGESWVMIRIIPSGRIACAAHLLLGFCVEKTVYDEILEGLHNLKTDLEGAARERYERDLERYNMIPDRWQYPEPEMTELPRIIENNNMISYINVDKKRPSVFYGVFSRFAQSVRKRLLRERCTSAAQVCSNGKLYQVRNVARCKMEDLIEFCTTKQDGLLIRGGRAPKPCVLPGMEDLNLHTMPDGPLKDPHILDHIVGHGLYSHASEKLVESTQSH